MTWKALDLNRKINLYLAKIGVSTAETAKTQYEAAASGAVALKKVNAPELLYAAFSLLMNVSRDERRAGSGSDWFATLLSGRAESFTLRHYIGLHETETSRRQTDRATASDELGRPSGA